MDGSPMVASGILPVEAGGGGGLVAASQLLDKLQSSLSYAPSGVPLPPLCCLCLENIGIVLQTTTAILYSKPHSVWDFEQPDTSFDFLNLTTDGQICGQYSS